MKAVRVKWKRAFFKEPTEFRIFVPQINKRWEQRGTVRYVKSRKLWYIHVPETNIAEAGKWWIPSKEKVLIELKRRFGDKVELRT